jgi:hypothetical protein
MFKPDDAISLINSKFINYLAVALTTPTSTNKKDKAGNTIYNNDGNPYLKGK